MAAAQIALGIEMDNRMKRKAAAMGGFLNVETQKKFLKMSSNVELQGKVAEERKIAGDLYNWNQRVVETTCRQNTEIRKLDTEIRKLNVENQKLKDENES